jgi:hypothetical protein
MKLLEENRGMLQDIEIGKDFFFLKDPKSTGNKAKRDKWDYMKLKSFYTAKETINREKYNIEDGRNCLQSLIRY